MSFNKKKESKNKNIPFQHLAPIDDVDENVFFDAFDYALNQRNIRNVALTGNYGSGKSSILDSYIKRQEKCRLVEFLLSYMVKIPLLNRLIYKFKKHWFLKVSLATFAVEKDDSDVNQNENADILPETTIQKIEKSILQQIFYRKSGERLQYSHFNRIENIGFFKKIFLEIAIFFMFLVPVYTIDGKIWSFIIKLFSYQGNALNSVIKILFLIVVAVSFYKVISIICKIRLSKFSFQNTEIEVECGEKEESLLNKYLDELLYYFEVTEYDVVIIEDLDRFKNTEIFIKLRELNTLLNNYEKIKRKIVFVYALRDEIFKDRSRTKFFDFIIPVIPVVNNQNSSDVLLNLKQENKGSFLDEIDENFLQDVCLYVDDMRLLKNSINEFKIYDRIINKVDYENPVDPQKNSSLNRNKIFALILYKNLFPKDFALLAKNNGELYSVFLKKNDVVKEKVSRLQSQIERLKEYVEKREHELALSLDGLRAIYVAKIFSKIPDGYYIEKKDYDFLSEESFENIRQSSLVNAYSFSGYGRSYNSNGFPYDFSEIEKEVDSLYSYSQREKMLKEKIGLEKDYIKQQIEDLKIEVSNAKQMPISKLIDEFSIDVLTSELKSVNKDFVVYLLRNEYIEENYFDYISYFHADSLNENDKKYLLGVKNQKEPLFDLSLSKVEYLVNRIKDFEWSLPAVLNYSMLSFLLRKKESHLEEFVLTLWKYKQEKECSFLCNFYEESEFLNILYQKIHDNFSHTDNWLEILFNEGNDVVLYNFFIYANFDKTELDFIEFLLKDVSFLHCEDLNEKVVSRKIECLNLKFNLLDDTKKFPVYGIILQNSAYEISRNNFDVIIGCKNANDYYTQIINLRNENVVNYIKQNIETFVRKVVLFENAPVAENENSFIELLNMELLDTTTKIELIKRNDNLVSDLNKVKSVELVLADNENNSADLKNSLFKYKKIKPTWDNVLRFFEYNSKKINSDLIEFFNDEKIVLELTQNEPRIEENVGGSSNDLELFFDAVLESKELKLKSFVALMKVCSWVYNKLDVYDISYEKMEALIDLNQLTLTAENYAGLKQYHQDLLSKYVGSLFDKFIDEWQKLNISIDLSDLTDFLDGKNLSAKQKKTLLTTEFDAWQSRLQKETLIWLGKKVVELECSEQLYVSPYSILDALDEENDVLNFISLQAQYVDNDQIVNAVNNKMGEEYKSCCAHEGKHIKLPYSITNMKFLKKLQKKQLISSYKQEENEIRIVQKRS